MDIRSLGYRTELIFSQFDGDIFDRGRHIAVRTPNNPTYHWGNYLLFDAPPTHGSLEEWQSIFADEIGRPPSIDHFAFGWDTIDGDCGEIQPFLDAGYVLDETVVLATPHVEYPPHYNPDIVIRPIASDVEWNAITAYNVEARDPALYSLESYTEFMTRQMSRRRRMVDAGLGQWFGAFLEGRLVAHLGIFHDGDIARYQSVDTHPDFRRRGICGTLVYESARWAQENLGVKTLVMIADEHYHAARIYESVGFKPIENIRGVTWWKNAT